MQPADAFNFANQVGGSVQEQFTQALGTGILASEIPKKADDIRAFAEQFGETEQGIWGDTVGNIRNNRNRIDQAFGSPNYWTGIADERAGMARDASKTANQSYQDAIAYSNEVRANNERAYNDFQEAKAFALEDLSQQQVYSMESLNQGNSALVEEAARKRAETLYGQGFAPDEMQVTQANEALQAEYARHLGDQQKQINMGYAEQRRTLHENLITARNNLESIMSTALNTAEGQEKQAATDAATISLASGAAIEEAYKTAAENTVMVNNALNEMDVMASGIEQEIETRRQDLYLKAEELELMGITAVAGALLGWNISVPQMRPKAEGGGGGGGGGSIGLGVEAGGVGVSGSVPV